MGNARGLHGPACWFSHGAPRLRRSGGLRPLRQSLGDLLLGVVRRAAAALPAYLLRARPARWMSRRPAWSQGVTQRHVDAAPPEARRSTPAASSGPTETLSWSENPLFFHGEHVPRAADRDRSGPIVCGIHGADARILTGDLLITELGSGPSGDFVLIWAKYGKHDGYSCAEQLHLGRIGGDLSFFSYANLTHEMLTEARTASCELLTLLKSQGHAGGSQTCERQSRRRSSSTLRSTVSTPGPMDGLTICSSGTTRSPASAFESLLQGPKASSFSIRHPTDATSARLWALMAPTSR